MIQFIYRKFKDRKTNLVLQVRIVVILAIPVETGRGYVIGSWVAGNTLFLKLNAGYMAG